MNNFQMLSKCCHKDISPFKNPVFMRVCGVLTTIPTQLYFKDGIFFWSERDFEFHEKEKDESTWIAARSVRWRVKDNALGREMLYMVD